MFSRYQWAFQYGSAIKQRCVYVAIPSYRTCCSRTFQIGLKTRQFINIEEDADGGTAPATHVRLLTIIMRTAASSSALVTHADLTTTMQGDASFAESNAAAQTMLNKFKNVAKKGADVDAQV